MTESILLASVTPVIVEILIVVATLSDGLEVG